jgi:drug/metabolite transporter (DMT)-like permease
VLPTNELLALTAVIVGLLANTSANLLGRRINRDRDLTPLTVTTVSIGVGATILLVGGALIEGVPILVPTHWAIISWLAVVNTAFAFTLWNHVLRTLTAVESSIIANTTLILVPILAWLFLGEGLTWQEVTGLALAGLGILVVQSSRH